MTFEQFAAVVRDWARQMMPAQIRLAAGNILLSVFDLPRGTTPAQALAKAAEGSEPTIGAVLLEAAKSEPASMLTGEPRKQAGRGRIASAPIGVDHPVDHRAADDAARQPVDKRAKALVKEQLKNGPRPESTVMAAAHLADIPKRTLIAAADALGVRTQRGQWWLPG